ncbi:hypothetical protein AOQ84DRAFT_422597 [Glonium stellatum]|uniref:DUF7492 domain-containing protein n=1 Tax=Glonium stellatum TaxID=574774 RepID=A0A8E2EPI1_9PEZI|nr:hypothetical protein AOQ84DRAFT_422597 [Glonium stellatum]
MPLVLQNSSWLCVIYILYFCYAYTWVERTSLIDDYGVLGASPGFSRGYVSHTPLFADASMIYLLPPNDRNANTILPIDLICKQTQAEYNQTLGSPVLSASTGGTVLLMYQENGHVTLLDQTPGKASSGNVFVYGTAIPSSSNSLQAIHHVWNSEGTGGDTRGRLLIEAPFNNGSCYQINSSPESIRRQGIPQRQHETFEGDNLWCGMQIALPSGVAQGSFYTLYWQEIYTTCVDIQIS